MCLSQRMIAFNQVSDKNKVTLKLFISPRVVNFFALFFLFFSESTRVLPLLLVSPGTIRKLDLRNSLSQMFYVLNQFFYFGFVYWLDILCIRQFLNMLNIFECARQVQDPASCAMKKNKRSRRITRQVQDLAWQLKVKESKNNGITRITKIQK